MIKGAAEAAHAAQRFRGGNTAPVSNSSHTAPLICPAETTDGFATNPRCSTARQPTQIGEGEDLPRAAALSFSLSVLSLDAGGSGQEILVIRG